MLSSLLFVAALVAALWRLARHTGRRPDLASACATGLLTFILMESMVARYLLSLGNPVSLLILYCLLGLPPILAAGAAPTAPRRT